MSNTNGTMGLAKGSHSPLSAKVITATGVVMSVRGNGNGWLGFVLCVIVIGAVVEIVKAILALIGIVFAVVVSVLIVVISLRGLESFRKDFIAGRGILSKSILPLCLIGLILLLFGQSILHLFQHESGMLWWYKKETQYLRMFLFFVLVTPIVYGFGYAIYDAFYAFILNNHNEKSQNTLYLK